MSLIHRLRWCTVCSQCWGPLIVISLIHRLRWCTVYCQCWGPLIVYVSHSQVEMVYSLLSMLGTHDKDDMSRTLWAMSSSQDSCIAMRQSGKLYEPAQDIGISCTPD